MTKTKRIKRHYSPRKPILPSKVSQEVYDWVKAKSAADRRSASEFVFFTLEAAMHADQKGMRNV